MSFSVSPAVTIKETDLTGSVPSVSTNPGAIVGIFRWGPINQRILTTSEDVLVSVFHKPKTYTENTAQWTNHETFFTAASFLAYSSSLYVTRVVSAADPSTITATAANFVAKYPGKLGNSLSVSYVKSTGFETPVFTSDILNDDEISYNTNTFTILSDVDYTTSLSVGDNLMVGNSVAGYQYLTISARTVTSANVSGETVYTHVITFANRYTLAELDYSALTYKRVWGYASVLPIVPSAGSLHVVVKDLDGEITGVPGQILETYQNLSFTQGSTTPDGSNNYFKDVLEAKSAWINVSSASSLSAIAGSPFSYENLSGGADGDDETGISFGKVAAGWDLYGDANEVDVSFLVTGKSNGSSNIANYLTQNIAEKRKDCVVYFSPKLSDVVTPASSQEKTDNAIAFRNTVQNSSYWVMDTGYKYTYDKYNDVYRWVPLNGDIAGLCSRVLPWESPAGYTKGIIKNVMKLAYNPSKAQRDQLYIKDINPVMTQVGQGTILFGDKTGFGAQSAFNRINVRRLFITIEKQIATYSASLLFEFNDSVTQARFKNSVEPYLRDIQGQRGIFNFRIVADERVNTPEIIDQNVFRGDIYVKPARSINEIRLNFIATKTSTEFEEFIG
jgi:hypothetical protein